MTNPRKIPIITDHRSIINTWKNSLVLARDLDITAARVRMWKMRNAIPMEVWPSLIAAGAQGIPKRRWITWTLLMRTRTPRQGQI